MVYSYLINYNHTIGGPVFTVMSGERYNDNDTDSEGALLLPPSFSIALSHSRSPSLPRFLPYVTLSAGIYSNKDIVQ